MLPHHYQETAAETEWVTLTVKKANSWKTDSPLIKQKPSYITKWMHTVHFFVYLCVFWETDASKAQGFCKI